MFESFIGNLISLGTWGLILGTILSSSVLPIPSESVLLAIGLSGINPIEAAIYGSIGSTLGSIVAYWIGKKYGRRLVEKIGKYFFLTKKGIVVINKWSEKLGAATVFLSRIIPIVPHKIFSIIAGISSIDLKNFILFTFIGSIPRCFLLVYFGNLIQKLNNIWFILVSIITVFTFPLIFSKLVNLFKN